jgi:hypothetical protein
MQTKVGLPDGLNLGPSGGGDDVCRCSRLQELDIVVFLLSSVCIHRGLGGLVDVPDQGLM